MVNPSIASQLISEETDEIGLWVIVYDFIGFKPNPNFWVTSEELVAPMEDSSYNTAYTRPGIN